MPDLNREKLAELSKKVLSIEEEVLQEEKKYQEALSQGSAISLLVAIRGKIKGLQRKVGLFNGAIETRLKQLLKL